MPGDNIKMNGRLLAPIAMEGGLRFAIREGGRTVGAGVVAKIIKNRTAWGPGRLSIHGGWVGRRRAPAQKLVEIHHGQSEHPHPPEGGSTIA